MKLKIEGKEYDLAAALERPTLFLVREMKIRTGYGMKAIMDAGERFKGKSGIEILDDEDLTGALIAMIWLARRSEGEQLTYEQAGSFDITALEAVADPEPELPGAGVEIPKAPATGSAPDDAPAPEPETPAAG